MKLITRAEISVLLGIKKNRLCEIINRHKYLAFPPPVCLRMRIHWYNEAEVIAWDKAVDHRNVKWRPMLKPTAAKPDSFDNDMAIRFITKPAITDEEKTYSQVIKKHITRPAKTTVVHLQERNDYTPPHSGMALFRTGDSYRVAHDGGGW